MNRREKSNQKMVWVEYFVHRLCTEDWVVAPQVIDFSNLVYVVSGKGKYQVEEEIYEVGPHSLIYVPYGSFRQASTRPEEPMCLYAVDFHYVSVNGQEERLALPIHSHLGEDTERLEHMFRRMDSQVAMRGGSYGLAVNAVFSEILSFLLPEGGSEGQAFTDERIQQVVDYVLEHIDRPVSTKEVADHVYLNPSYLNTIVRGATGKTLTNYMNFLRISVAENILRYENVSVQEVAERCGFSDMAYFSRVFKHLKGYPPITVKRVRSDPERNAERGS